MAIKRTYWSQRAKQSDERTQKQILESQKKILRSFETQVSQIEAAIEKFYKSYAKENKISPAEARKLLTPKEKDAFRRKLSSMAKTSTTAEESHYLQDLKSRVRLNRLTALSAEMRYYINKFTSDTNVELDTTLEKIFKTQESHQQYNIENALRLKLDYSKRSPTQIKTILNTGYDGQNYSSKVWYNRDRLALKLETLIPQQFTIGSSSEKLAAEISKEFKTSLNSAMRLVRTEGAFVASQADKILYSEVSIEKYEFYATLDSTTSEVCRSLDGMVFKTSEAKVGINLPPMHPNCRSTTLPHVDVSDLDNYRLARDEDGKYVKVSPQTYNEWKSSTEKEN